LVLIGNVQITFGVIWHFVLSFFGKFSLNTKVKETDDVRKRRDVSTFGYILLAGM